MLMLSKTCIGKWNYKTKDYDDYTPPAGAELFSEDLEQPVACAACGKKIKFGDGYTSREIHNHAGFGFIVCAKCYESELKRFEKYSK